MKPFIAALCFLICFPVITAFKSKDPTPHGIITYNISLRNDRVSESIKKRFSDARMKFIWDSGHSRTSLRLPILNFNIITDQEEALLMMDMGPQKFATPMTMSQLATYKNDKNIDYQAVNKQDQTINLAGYECKKAVLVAKYKGRKLKMGYWYTKAIEAPKTSMQYAHKGLEGFPLKMEYLNKDIGGVLSFEVSEVNLEAKPPPGTFGMHIPEKYQKRSFEALQGN